MKNLKLLIDPEELDRVFDTFDDDQSGELDVEEMTALCHHLGLYVDKENVVSMMEDLDDNKSGTLDRGQFHKLFFMSHLKRVFESFDDDGDGTVAADELHLALEKLGVFIGQKKVLELFAKVDEDGNGTLDFEEFMELFEMLPEEVCHTNEEGGSALRMGAIMRTWLPDDYTSEPHRVRTSVPLPDLRRVFQKFDADNSGDLDGYEFGAAARQLGIKITDEDAIEILKKADKDGSCTLDFDEFCEMFDLANLRTVFDEIDADHSGEIDLDELCEALDALGVQMTRGDVEAMLKSVDKDGSMSVDFDEFQEFFANIPLANLKSVAEQWARMADIDLASPFSVSVPAAGQLPWHYIVAGGSSGVVSRTLTAPLERVKIMAQTQGGLKTWDCLRNIVKREGWKSLWKGNGANILRVFPTSAIVLLTYVNAKNFLNPGKDVNTLYHLKMFTAAAAAGVISQTLTYPLGVVMARLSVATNEAYSGIWDCLKKTVAEEGSAGLFKGLSPTLGAAVPFLAMQKMFYEMYKKQALRQFDPSFPVCFSCAVASGLTALTITFPLDMIRRRIQISHKGVTVRSLAKEVFAVHGWKGMFAGLTPTILKTGPAVGIACIVKDYMLERLKTTQFSFGREKVDA